MQISDHIHAGVLVLTLEGRMDFQGRKVFQAAIENAKISRPQQVILNFSHVPFIDSAGLGLLMVVHKSLEEANIRLSLEVSEGYVLQVLTLANIAKTIPISTTVAQPSPSGFSRLGPIRRNA